MARQVIDACEIDCSVGNYDEFKNNGDAIWMIYSFMYDSTLLNGDGNITFDRHSNDSTSIKTAYIECSFRKGAL
ncbi:MAG: hypothetical protein HFH14_06045 [Lachnospiraceae bacterium]|nr:hypothetical protein [Lachnospiraceae bacterium]